MAALPIVDYVLWNTVIAISINGKIKAFIPFGDYNRQDVLEIILQGQHMNKLEFLNNLPVLWSKK